MGSPRFTYEFVKSVIEDKGGTLLSKEYVNCDTKLCIKCSNNHIFDMSFYCLKNQKQWCPHCAGLAKPSIEVLKKYAKQKGGILISNEYVNGMFPMKWKCQKGHEWLSSWKNVKRDSTWCPNCAGNKSHTLKEVGAIVSQKGGTLLSEKYVNNKTKLEIRCENNHLFESSLGDILKGHWCLQCSGLSKPDISVLRAHAKSKNGRLLSNSYKNSQTPLLWRCKNGHEWMANWGNVKNQNTWCQACYLSVFAPSGPQIELYKLVKQIHSKAKLEYRFKNYSLDIAIPELKINIEYDGTYWHKNRRKEDGLRDEYLKSEGWKVFRFEDRIPPKAELRKLLESVE